MDKAGEEGFRGELFRQSFDDWYAATVDQGRSRSKMALHADLHCERRIRAQIRSMTLTHALTV